MEPASSLPNSQQLTADLCPAEHDYSAYFHTMFLKVGFEVLTSVVMKWSVLRYITLCSLVKCNRSSGGTSHASSWLLAWLKISDLMMALTCFFGTSDNFHRNAQRCISKDRNVFDSFVSVQNDFSTYSEVFNLISFIQVPNFQRVYEFISSHTYVLFVLCFMGLISLIVFVESQKLWKS
jgi:hypothetical protein